MKQRIISAAAGLGILTVALIFFDTLLVNFLAAGISVLAVLELFNAAGLTKYRFFSICSAAYCALIVFLDTTAISLFFARISYLFVILIFLFLLKNHETVHIQEVGYGFLMSVLVAASFYCLIMMKGQSNAQYGVFYLMLSFGSAWWSDSGAYFVGTFLGKTKLCPTISPKKTVEGLVGGILTAIVGNVLVCLVYQSFCAAAAPLGYIRSAVSINIWAVVLVTPFLSLLGVLGDLSASVIKRQFGIKDYGHIMPGHGGVMDRFDSVLFISPLIYFIFNIYPLISAI